MSKMKASLFIGIVFMLLISGCAGYNNEKLEVPVSGAPYDYKSLSLVTVRFPMKMVKDAELAEIGDTILEKMAPEIKTFTGEKYKKFSPELELVEENNDTISFLFKGEGFADAISFDEYQISLYYDKKTKEVSFDQKNFRWSGIPLQYKVMAEELGRKKAGVGKDVQSGFTVWDPENPGKITVRFESKILVVDLENGEVVESE